MRYPTQVKPSRFLKANTAAKLSRLGAKGELLGTEVEAKTLLQEIAPFERTRKSLALLEILALGNRQLEEGKVITLAEVKERLRLRTKNRRSPECRGDNRDSGL